MAGLSQSLPADCAMVGRRRGTFVAAAFAFAPAVGQLVNMGTPAPTVTPAATDNRLGLRISYVGSSLQPLADVTVGGQRLQLVFDLSSPNLVVFVAEAGACVPAGWQPCYSWQAADAQQTLKVCSENQDDETCGIYGAEEEVNGPQQKMYECASSFLACGDGAEQVGPPVAGRLPSCLSSSHAETLVIDGLKYNSSSVEALEKVSVTLLGGEASPHRLIQNELSWEVVPTALVVAPFRAERAPGSAEPSLELFARVGGILGASGPSLSCRNETLWNTLLSQLNVTHFSLNFRPPPQSRFAESEGTEGSVDFNYIDPAFKDAIIWSQPKQTGDLFNNGMHEFLLYHPEVCGVDLLYNASSNWLVVLDTSGPCLTLPRFLFDHLATWIPITCPFDINDPNSNSEGRLCSPDRSRGDGREGTGSALPTLPALSFALEDLQDPLPPRITIPLERLVFRENGTEYLCVARADPGAGESVYAADMMSSFISFGSLAVAATYATIDLESYRVGFAGRGSPEESSNAYCAANVTCASPMQTYFPPKNLCEDPHCQEYMFMTLDPNTKACVWAGAVPFGFCALLITLALLDLASHRLYKQAIDRASEYCQQ